MSTVTRESDTHVAGSCARRDRGRVVIAFDGIAPDVEAHADELSRRRRSFARAPRGSRRHSRRAGADDRRSVVRMGGYPDGPGRKARRPGRMGRDEAK